jgi:hypothetical protein
MNKNKINFENDESKKKQLFSFAWLIKHDIMKPYGCGGTAPPFLTLALDGSKW